MKKAAHRHAEGAAQWRETELQVERQLRIAFSELNKAKEQFAIQQERTQLNKDLFKTSEQQFEGGKVDLLQLLQADNALFGSELSLINMKFSVTAAQFGVLANMGKLRDVMTQDNGVYTKLISNETGISAQVPVSRDHGTENKTDVIMKEGRLSVPSEVETTEIVRMTDSMQIKSMARGNDETSRDK
jgi:hypothetical protein